jgi:hypothetical protein
MPRLAFRTQLLVNVNEDKKVSPVSKISKLKSNFTVSAIKFVLTALVSLSSALLPVGFDTNNQQEVRPLLPASKLSMPFKPAYDDSL